MMRSKAMMAAEKNRKRYVRWLEELSSADANIVGGKNSSLGEMISALKKKKVRVPVDFATTAEAYWHFLKENNIEEKIRDQVNRLKKDRETVPEVGKAIRKMFIGGRIPEEIEEEICDCY
jgi:pyruvate,water dikinase